MTPREVLGLPEPTTHELAAIMQFSTSYELVEWLAQCLQEVLGLLAQEHKDQIIIQKTLVGVVDPEAQQEVNRIGQQHNTKNKGEAIHLAPLHEALVEVHKEYECTSRVAKDMVELYKKATTASEVLNDKCTRTQAKKEELSYKFRQTEEKLRKVEEELLIHQQPAKLSDFEQELN